MNWPMDEDIVKPGEEPGWDGSASEGDLASYALSIHQILETDSDAVSSIVRMAKQTNEAAQPPTLCEHGEAGPHRFYAGLHAYHNCKFWLGRGRR